MSVVAQELVKDYGARRALDGVSFTIDDGEIVGLVGPNGAGKTTLLKILCGAMAPSAGCVHVAGIDGRRDPRALRRRVGFLPDRPPLYDEMRVREMLDFAARINGVPARASVRRVAEVLGQCHLEEVADDCVGWLSHGYRQRLGIAQAIVHQPALVILDEPTSGLDPAQIVEARHLLTSLARHHTVLVSSHILAELEQTCDRYIFLHQGRIVAEGGLETLRRALPRGRFTLCGSGSPARARQVAESVDGVDVTEVRAQQDGFMLEAVAARVDCRAALVSALVGAGLGVSLVERASVGELESVFLGLTRRGAR